ncbi:hypothetical protein GP5015_235 [gamma proteobacterium HTCC5015]|nr:hypothetical protein GP5015_235 [gamma proteobacterium HTCC5015]
MKKVLLALIAIVGMSPALCAQNIDAQKLTLDLQKMHHDGNTLHLAWWLPNEHWEASFKDALGISPEEKTSILSELDQYIIFTAMEGKIGPFGGITGTPKDKLLPKISLETSETTLLPLSESNISPDIKHFLSVMKPTFANMLGQFGNAIEFVIFKDRNNGKENILNAKSDGAFTLIIGEQDLKWQLPLGSLMPPKFDPDTGDEFPGNYSYNPFSGKKLITR